MEGTGRIGSYEILERLGEGAYGIVYKARDTESPDGAVVALKQLRARWQDAESRLAFEREAAKLRQLNHPNIVRCLDTFHAEIAGENVPCMALEFIDGRSLQQRIDDHPKGLPITVALDALLQCANALTYAASEGVVHRDIKPANIIIRHDGTAKLLDFGIAVAALPCEAGQEEQAENTDYKGTLSYAAPELAEMTDQPVFDQQSDIFSFGITMVEALTGKHPYEQRNTTDIALYDQFFEWARNVTEDDLIPVHSIFRDKRLETLVQRCVSPDRNRRFERFADVAKEIAAIKTLYVRGASGDEYRLIKRLGKGAFGAVFLTERTRDAKLLALKKLFNIHDPGRFLQEIKILQSVQHPNVVDYVDHYCTVDIEQAAEAEYGMLLEYLDGPTLHRRIRDNPDGIPVAEILRLFVGYAAALQHCHDRKPCVVHRDIKPGNLFAAPTQLPKVFDFGIAREDDGRTTVGGIPCTPDYLAPEFADKHDGVFRGDERTDLYSLGVSLYQALTGKLPLAPLPRSVAKALKEYFERARQRRMTISYDQDVFTAYPKLKAITSRLLERKPKKRYQTAQELRDDLQEVLATMNEEQTIAPSPDDQPHSLPPTEKEEDADFEPTIQNLDAGDAPGPPPVPGGSGAAPPAMRRPLPWRAIIAGAALFVVLLAFAVRPFLNRGPGPGEEPPGDNTNQVAMAHPPAVPQHAHGRPAATNLPARSPDVPRNVTPTQAPPRTVDTPLPHPPVVPPTAAPEPKEYVLAVATAPAGASVHVNGHYYGLTPLTITNRSLDVPTLVLELAKTGYRPVKRTFQGTDLSMSTSPIRLEEQAGTLDVTTSPAGATIEVAGRTATSPAGLSLPPGEHQLRITKPGYVPHTTRVSIADGQRRDLGPIALKPANATLDVTSDPPGALIWLNGTPSTRSTPASVVLTPGRETIVHVTKADYLDSAKERIHPEAGQTYRARFTLEKRQVIARNCLITGVVPGTQIVMDNRVIGTSKGETFEIRNLPTGVHTFRARHPDYRTPPEQSAEAKQSDILEIQFKMLPKGATIVIQPRLPEGYAGQGRAEVLVNGVNRGEQLLPYTVMGLPPGVAEVQLAGRQWTHTAPRSVRLSKDQDATITYELTPNYATLHFRVKPAGAEVFINDRPVFKDKVTVLPDLEHRIAIHADGYAPYVTTMKLEPGQRKWVDASLRRQ